MTPASRIPLNSLHTFAKLKLEEQLGRWRDHVLRVRAVAPGTCAHALLLGGFAGMAYGAWMIWHPLGPLVGGWFALRVATMIAEEMARQGRG